MQEIRMINLFMDKMRAATTRKDQLQATGVFLTYFGSIPGFLSVNARFRATLIEELELWRSWGLDERDICRAKDLLVQVKRRKDYVLAEGEEPEQLEVTSLVQGPWATECRMINLFMDKIDGAKTLREKRDAASVLLTYVQSIPGFLSVNTDFRNSLIRFRYIIGCQKYEGLNSAGLRQSLYLT